MISRLIHQVCLICSQPTKLWNEEPHKPWFNGSKAKVNTNSQAQVTLIKSGCAWTGFSEGSAGCSWTEERGDDVYCHLHGAWCWVIINLSLYPFVFSVAISIARYFPKISDSYIDLSWPLTFPKFLASREPAFTKTILENGVFHISLQ